MLAFTRRRRRSRRRKKSNFCNLNLPIRFLVSKRRAAFLSCCSRSSCPESASSSATSSAAASSAAESEAISTDDGVAEIGEQLRQSRTKRSRRLKPSSALLS